MKNMPLTQYFIALTATLNIANMPLAVSRSTSTPNENRKLGTGLAAMRRALTGTAGSRAGGPMVFITDIC
jgi:hypothetical protein